MFDGFLELVTATGIAKAHNLSLKDSERIRSDRFP